MTCVFACEARFEKGADGKIYSPDGSFSLKLWSRYLAAFDHLIVMARVLPTDKVFDPSFVAESERVSFAELPYYIGPLQFLKKRDRLISEIKKHVRSDRAYILRTGMIAKLLSQELRKTGVPYGVELVGDPWDVFAPGVVSHPLRPLIRVSGCLSQKKLARNAATALYVTDSYLQKRYPCKPGRLSIGVSDVVICERDIAVRPKIMNVSDDHALEIISVGSLSQMYKSPDVAIEAIRILKSRGIPCHLTWLGDGIYREKMIRLAIQKDVGGQCNFVGSVAAGRMVREYLDRSDLFILVSRTEGLPRALVEAMAAGLPCIGTDVGGIPELLPADVLVPPNSPEQLADKIEYMMRTPAFADKQAQMNLEKSHRYCEAELDQRRMEFFLEIRKISEQ